MQYEFEVAEEGSYAVSVLKLPGCVSEGKDFEEALQMIQDAMAGWLAMAHKQGDTIPSKFRKLAENISRQIWLVGCPQSDPARSYGPWRRRGLLLSTKRAPSDNEAPLQQA